LFHAIDCDSIGKLLALQFARPHASSTTAPVSYACTTSYTTEKTGSSYPFFWGAGPYL